MGEKVLEEKVLEAQVLAAGKTGRVRPMWGARFWVTREGGVLLQAAVDQPYCCTTRLTCLAPSAGEEGVVHLVTRGGGTSKWPGGLSLHPKGSTMVTSRRMNVGNARALRRALRRARGFAKLARKVLVATSHYKKGGGHHRRKK